MIVGHVGIAFGTRALRRDAPLVLLIGAAFLPDAGDGVLRLAAICNPYGTYTHSLPASALLAVAAAAVALAWSRSRALALVAGGLVLTHLPLDLITGQKALWLGGPVAGLYFYRFPLWDFIIELPVLLLGWMMLRRAGGAPAWATSVLTLACLLAVQAGADLRNARRSQRPPTRCERSALPRP
ncbi:MAG TPA: metal-dependent hydrolase [Gemmatimonadaceae bacterium]|nr:metal-dependent hydrolase [Gemmatimonadaceae bacterium]